MINLTGILITILILSFHGSYAIGNELRPSEQWVDSIIDRFKRSGVDECYSELAALQVQPVEVLGESGHLVGEAVELICQLVQRQVSYERQISITNHILSIIIDQRARGRGTNVDGAHQSAGRSIGIRRAPSTDDTEEQLSESQSKTEAEPQGQATQAYDGPTRLDRFESSEGSDQVTSGYSPPEERLTDRMRTDAIRLVEMAMAMDPGVQNALLQRLLGGQGSPPPKK